MTLTAPLSPAHRWIALLLLVGMAGTVLIALGFEHIGGYIPCYLCLQQRIPYYVGAPLMALAALGAWMNWPAWSVRVLLLAGALLMTIGLGLGVYHSGVEWGFWQGPANCAAVPSPVSTGKGILDAINTQIPPSCTDAPWRMLGLSFAGWNVVASLVLGAIAWRGALGR